MRVTKICSSCGSEDVWVDANAEWNTDTQQFELKNTFDAEWCDECDSETSIEEKEIQE